MPGNWIFHFSRPLGISVCDVIDQRSLLVPYVLIGQVSYFPAAFTTAVATCCRFSCSIILYIRLENWYDKRVLMSATKEDITRCGQRCSRVTIIFSPLSFQSRGHWFILLKKSIIVFKKKKNNNNNQNLHSASGLSCFPLSRNDDYLWEKHIFPCQYI